jgi:hypothetical protein
MLASHVRVNPFGLSGKKNACCTFTLVGPQSPTTVDEQTERAYFEFSGQRTFCAKR